jgi:succinylarginine dihydrolase
MREVNFDGLIGPTHSYAGLSFGNLASDRNRGEVARPRDAALQGLAKMRVLMELGFTQGILPPHPRPHLPTLRALGYAGSDTELLRAAAVDDPTLHANVCSASAMWTANAATVGPSADTRDGRLHLVPANLASKLHRLIEAPQTTRALRAIFADAGHFVVHEPLPACSQLGDEGAANHTRLHPVGDIGRGVHLFVYGRRALQVGAPAPTRYPARQTLEASQAVARLLQLDPDRTVFAQQHPDVIDQGVFHNDVIAVGSGSAMLYHEHAWADGERVLDELEARAGFPLIRLRVTADELSVADAVASYLFNSQLLVRPDGGITLIAPSECANQPRTAAVLDRLVRDPANPVDDVRLLDVRQSMKNGGGPACLRLRVVMTDAQLAALRGRCILTPALVHELTAWIERHYRQELSVEDTLDPALLHESQTALAELQQILQLDGLYPSP